MVLHPAGGRQKCRILRLNVMDVAVLYRAPSWAIRLQRIAGIVIDLDTQAGTEADRKIPGQAKLCPSDRPPLFRNRKPV